MWTVCLVSANPPPPVLLVSAPTPPPPACLVSAPIPPRARLVSAPIPPRAPRSHPPPPRASVAPNSPSPPCASLALTPPPPPPRLVKRGARSRSNNVPYPQVPCSWQLLPSHPPNNSPILWRPPSVFWETFASCRRPWCNRKGMKGTFCCIPRKPSKRLTLLKKKLVLRTRKEFFVAVLPKGGSRHPGGRRPAAGEPSLMKYDRSNSVGLPLFHCL